MSAYRGGFIHKLHPGGGSNGAQIVSHPVADVNLSGHKAVAALFNRKVVYADSSDPSTLNSIVGVTAGAVLAGDNANVVSSGEIIEPTWSWTANLPIFVGIAGALTQVPPTSGYIARIGVATSPTSMLVNLTQPLALI